ncbi:MAG: putative C-S lyase [Proteobacteria bacterium]|nr:putative C-S lyase [Pseudomonadota bacterium]
MKFDAETMQGIFGTSELWPSWVADMDFRAAPEIIEALSLRVDHGVFGYEVSRGDLRGAVASWYQNRYAWSFNPEHIISTPRTLNSLAVLINLFSSKGDGVIVQPPVFYDFKLILRAGKRRLVKNPLKLEQGKYQMDFDHLESVTADPDNKLLILCNPHNPLGRVWPNKDLARLSEICLRNNVFIIADEIHGDITYQGRYTPVASISHETSLYSATCISPVKSFNLAGVANSMIVIEDEEKRKACTDWYKRMEINKNNVFSNAAMLAAYTKGEPWLEQVTDYLRGNIAILRNFLQLKTPLIKFVEPEASYLVWLDFRETGLDARQLETFLVSDAQMAVNPGHWFGREGAGFARINIACPRSMLHAALVNLEKAYTGISSGLQH